MSTLDYPEPPPPLGWRHYRVNWLCRERRV